MSANVTFGAIAALLVVAVLALLLLPLLRRSTAAAPASAAELSLDVLRDQLAEIESERAAGCIDAASAERERAELERRALEDGQGSASPAALESRRWRYGAALALIVPLVAGGAYWQLGTPSAIGGRQPQGGHALGPQQIQAMAAKLAERLQQNPADGEGWLMLGRSYAVLGRHAEAAAALGRATAILPPNATVLADYADVLAMAQGRRLSGEPEKIIARALAADPNHVKALALSGSAAFERQDYPRAIATWEKILGLVPPESNVAQGIGRSIADARSRLGQPAQGAASVAGAPAGAAAGASVAGVVSIDPRLLENGSVKPGDTVFVFARAIEGGRAPLAMLRLTAAQLPARFTLDDSLSMMPNARISGAKQVIVGARVAKSGMPQATPGDFEGLSNAVDVGSKDIRILIAKPVQ